MEDKLEKLRKTANKTIFREKRFNEEQKRKVFRQIRKEQSPKNEGFHRVLTAVFIFCFVSFTGYLFSQEIKVDEERNSKEGIFHSDGPADSLNKHIIQLKGPLDPNVPFVLPGSSPSAPDTDIEKVLNLNGIELTRKNTSISLNVTIKEDSADISMEGKIQMGHQSVGVNGTGWVTPVEIGEENYYYASLDMTYSKAEKQGEDVNLGAGGGIFYLGTDDPNDFRGTITISNSDGAVGLSFGEGMDISRLIENKLSEMEEKKGTNTETTGHVLSVSDSSVWVVPGLSEEELQLSWEELWGKYKGDGIVFTLEEIDHSTISKLEGGQQIHVKHSPAFIYSSPPQTAAIEVKNLSGK
ncbi:DUF3221 domain-containing protein [Indiicoccus explosivorum]|uniref:DUF3221 domain-containing protein n=1 Tax=Indiicoccus explosivorum TaxID=1917864 RepID=UPI000B437898|nr:DUF3221 domain-containing protein [Indiicoccus explosivorum]